MSEIAYKLSQLRYRYPGSRFELEIDSMEIASARIIALVGPNGAGKTTLLMILGLLQKPGAGRIEFFGADPWKNNRVMESRREVVLVTHHPYLFRGTVFDNLKFGLKVRGAGENEWETRVREALAMVELSGFEKKSVSELSAGQAQRVALARAIILKPRVLLLDEPTANIDAGMSNRIEAMISEINAREKTTIILSTHNFSQAFRLAGEVVYFSDGKRVPYSHENFFSGTAQSDGKISWIEPKPGVKIVFPGVRQGRVTVVVSPYKIRVFSKEQVDFSDSPNQFEGTVTRLELADGGQALVRLSGELNLRINLSMEEIDKKNIALSRQILVRFPPEAVEVIE